jgi:hypothetical protein
VEHARRLGKKACDKWFHANDIPRYKANSPYFRMVLKMTHYLGKEVTTQKGSEIDGIYLESNYKELKKHMAKRKDVWDTYGVTIMSDLWVGPNQMIIINFMFFSNSCIHFDKSVNATLNIQNSQYSMIISKRWPM